MNAMNMKKDNDMSANLGIDKKVPVKVGIKRFINENILREIKAIFLERFLNIKYS
jgi:hypothetical protein